MDAEVKPGRELDLVIASQVMHLPEIQVFEAANCWRYRKVEEDVSFQEELPHYSTQMGDAWEVVERLKAVNDPVSEEDNNSTEGFQIRALRLGGYMAGFAISDGSHEDDRFLGVWAKGETAPHAICLAALKAVGVEV